MSRYRKPKDQQLSLEAERFVDVSNLGTVPEGSKILARRNCEHCYGTGVKGYLVTDGGKQPDTTIQTKNKKCPSKTVRAKVQYDTHTPVYCQCLREYKKEEVK